MQNETNTTEKVFVITCRWSDRHGDDGLNTPVVRKTIEKAYEALIESVTDYLRTHDVLAEDEKTILKESYCECSLDATNLDDLVEQLKAADGFSINIDERGTWAEFDINEVEVE
jgi:hypothetical protein